MYGVADLQSLTSSAGFTVTGHEIFEDQRSLSWWMSVITPAPEIIAQIRQIMIASIPDDRPGLRVRLEHGELFYQRRNLIVAAVKP